MPRSQKTTTGIWVTHPTGNANVRGVVHGFHRRGILDTFHTCLGIGEDYNTPILSKALSQRTCPIPDAKIQRSPWREAARLLSEKFGCFGSLREHEIGRLCVDQIYHALDKAVARRLEKSHCRPTALYAYEDGAYQCFQAARRLGVTTIYDLPIGYWRTARRIQSEEAQRQPEWASTLQALLDSDEKVARKDEELQAADHIVVASQFTASTLKDAPFPLPQPIIIPYGCPTVTLSEPRKKQSDQKLKVLYVGSLSQRKGLSYLLDAVAQIGDAAELTIVGKRVAACAPLDAALKVHHWIPSLPHHEILDVMRAHDVFVFPSLFEGFGLVLTEALSQGLPIIATAHTCAPDIIQDGREGFIVPIRDADAIAEKLQLLADDSERLEAMKAAALTKAAQTKWQTYEDTLAAEIHAILTRPIDTL